MNKIGELVLTALFQSTFILNFWSMFYLLFFANFIQCTVQLERVGMICDSTGHNCNFPTYPIPWQNIPDEIIAQFQPPDASTTAKNRKTKIVWGVTIALANVFLISAIAVAHFKFKLHTGVFLLKNSIILAVLGALEALFFYLVGWYDFPVSQAKGASTYLRELLQKATVSA